MRAPARSVIGSVRDYELRLIGDDGHMVNVLAFRRGSDDAARQAILEVREPYARYELWRGMDKIADGGRFVVG